MATTNTIIDQFQVKYNAKWGVLLQQTVNRLEKYVTIDRDVAGKVKYYNDFGIIEFDEKKGRMKPTELSEAPTVSRALYPRFFNKAIGFDEWDGKNLGDLDLPIGKTVESLNAAAKRRMDKVMIEGFLGQNAVGENGVDKVSIPASQKVLKNYVESGTAADSGMTVAKLRKALDIFRKNEAWDNDDSGDALVLAMSSAQINDLLKSAEVTSADYVDIKALVDGKVDKYLGFNIVRTELLPITAGVRTCLAWVKSRAQFGIWADHTVKVSVRDDLDDTVQIRGKFGCGATRLQEEGFVVIECVEAA